ncbi:MAG: hypothetical protein EBX41_00115 [Chitinophagia bacterium]|nr:hypothetical protein [Chitinophagia bacterium]
MGIGPLQSFIMEMQMEAANTRKMLATVPFEHSDFKPHEKSMSLGRLATHIAEISGWTNTIIGADELDFAAREFKPYTATSVDDLLALQDSKVAAAIACLEGCTEADLYKTWTLRHGDHVFFTLPKIAVLRSFSYSHLFHHRGQLSVYLRLINVAVPGMYGPTADAPMMGAPKAAEAN